MDLEPEDKSFWSAGLIAPGTRIVMPESFYTSGCTFPPCKGGCQHPAFKAKHRMQRGEAKYSVNCTNARCSYRCYDHDYSLSIDLPTVATPALNCTGPGARVTGLGLYETEAGGIRGHKQQSGRKSPDCPHWYFYEFLLLSQTHQPVISFRELL